jgi:hypothetical protein
MSRDLSAEMQAVSTAEVVRPFYLLDMEFSSPVRLWTGLGELDAPYGDNFVSNSSFTSNLSSWSIFEAGTGTVTHSAGQANISGADFNNRAGVAQQMATVVGQKYIVSVAHTGSDLRLRLKNISTTTVFYDERIEAGYNQHTFTATDTTTEIYIYNQYGTAAANSFKLFNAQTYQGLGDILKIGQVAESTELQANGTSVTLTGVKTSLVQIARDEDYQGKTAAISLGAMNELNEPIVSPVSIFEGFMDVMTILDGGDKSTINVTLENKLIAFERKFVRRFTDNDQRIDHPTDKGFEFVASLQDKEIIFGRATPSSSVGNSGSSQDTR